MARKKGNNNKKKKNSREQHGVSSGHRLSREQLAMARTEEAPRRAAPTGRRDREVNMLKRLWCDIEIETKTETGDD